MKQKQKEPRLGFQICDFCKKEYKWEFERTGRILIFTEDADGLRDHGCHICKECEKKLTVTDFLNELGRIYVEKSKAKPEKVRKITAKEKQKMLTKLLRSIEEGKRKIG